MATRTRRDTVGERIDSIFEFLSQRWVMGIISFLPVSLLLLIVYVLPVGWSIAAGFHSISAYAPEWTWVGLQNYSELLSNPDFHETLYRSLIFAGGSVALQLVVGIAAAFLINRTFRTQYFVRSLVMLPYLVPTVLIGFITLWMGNSQFGIINQLMAQVGLIDSYLPWFGSTDLAMPALIVANSWKFSFFVTIMVLARLQSIPDGFYEAARMSGANRLQTFRDITLPNIKNVIFIVLLLRGIWMFNKFDLIWVMTRGGPLESTTTAPIYAYQVAFSEAQLGEAAAISTLMFILLFAVAIVYFWVLKPSSEVAVE